MLAPETELPVRNEHVRVASTEVTADFENKDDIVQGEGKEQRHEGRPTALLGEWSEAGQPVSSGEARVTWSPWMAGEGSTQVVCTGCC